MATSLENFMLFSLPLVLLLLSHQIRESTQTTDYHILQLSSLLESPVCNHSSAGRTDAGSLKVIHRHGPCSHLSTKHPSHEEILTRDELRVNSIRTRLASNLNKQNRQGDMAVLPAKPGSTFGSANYIVTIGLGTPKKDYTLAFDTGSDLTWTQCQPCSRSCYAQKDPIFTPSSSNSYSNITCNTLECSELITATGIQPSCASTTCVYGIQYGDQSFSVGFLAKEKLTLTPKDVVDNFIFGCGQNNQGLFGGTAGLLGLGRHNISIISQTAQKYGRVFSYCLPSTSSTVGHLTFGNSRVPKSVRFTPMSSGQGNLFYAINITSISVGGRKLRINQSVFSTAGTIIDSGTVITRLQPAAYKSLQTAFRAQMAKYPTTKPLSILDTCYDLSNYTTVTIPKISFFFSGNVKVDMDLAGILYANGTSQVCLAFAANGDASDVGIFGNTQQRTLEIVYNVAAGKLGFAPRGCS